MQPDQGQTYWQPDQEGEAPLGAESVDMGQEQDDSSDTHETVTWQASEYVHHEKHTMWYIVLVLVTVALLALALFTTQWSFAVLIAVLGVSVGVLAGRPPHQMRYSLTSHGIHINDKSFGYQDFRGFGVIQDGPFSSIVLIPNKRFMPMVNVYFPPEQGEEIVDVFGEFLPMEHVELDLVEKLARKIRF